MEVHKEEKVYVPELIFGHLLTSSNYDDDEKKVRLQIFGLHALLHSKQCHFCLTYKLIRNLASTPGSHNLT